MRVKKFLGALSVKLTRIVALAKNICTSSCCSGCCSYFSVCCYCFSTFTFSFPPYFFYQIRSLSKFHFKTEILSRSGNSNARVTNLLHKLSKKKTSSKSCRGKKFVF